MIFLLFVLAASFSWVFGWMIVQPEAKFLDSFKVATDEGRISFREYMHVKLNAVPGSETFAANLLSCRICIGTWAGFLVSLIGLSYPGSVGFKALLAVSCWFSSIVSHYMLNLLEFYLKGKSDGSYTP